MIVKCTTAAAITPFSLDEVKAHLRVSHTEEDAYITTLISAVTSIAENYIGRALFTSTWKFYLENFCKRKVTLPFPPLQSITSVRYYNGESWVTMGSDEYQVDNVSEPGLIVPAAGGVWPVVDVQTINPIEITFVAGYGARSELPPALRQALLYHITHLYDIREPVVIGTLAMKIPHTLIDIYQPYRILEFT